MAADTQDYRISEVGSGGGEITSTGQNDEIDLDDMDRNLKPSLSSNLGNGSERSITNTSLWDVADSPSQQKSTRIIDILPRYF